MYVIYTNSKTIQTFRIRCFVLLLMFLFKKKIIIVSLYNNEVIRYELCY